MAAASELDDADKAVLIALLKQTIFSDPFPLSPRVQRIARYLGEAGPVIMAAAT